MDGQLSHPFFEACQASFFISLSVAENIFSEEVINKQLPVPSLIFQWDGEKQLAASKQLKWKLSSPQQCWVNRDSGELAAVMAYLYWGRGLPSASQAIVAWWSGELIGKMRSPGSVLHLGPWNMTSSVEAAEKRKVFYLYKPENQSLWPLRRKC